MNAKGALILMALLVGGGLAFIAFLKLLLGVAVSILKTAALILAGVGSLAALAVLLALGLSLFQMARRESKRGREHRLLLQSIHLPRDAVIRGEAPSRSRLGQMLAVFMDHYITQEVGRDPRTLSDLELNEIRLGFAQFLRQPVFSALLEREFVQPTFRLLVNGDPFMLEQMRLYGQLEVRVDFWLVHRLLHVISGGRLGLSIKETWKTMSVEALQANYKDFGKWARNEGLPLIPLLETLIEAQHLKLGEGELGLGTQADQAQAEALVEGVRTVLAVDEPWSQPEERLSQMSEALDQARRMDPRHPGLDELVAQIQAMTKHLQDFEQDYAAALTSMSSPADPIPPWLDNAYALAADELSEETLKAHAVRLYLRMRAETPKGEAPTPLPVNPANTGTPLHQPDEIDREIDDDFDLPADPEDNTFAIPLPPHCPPHPIDPHAAAHAQATF